MQAHVNFRYEKNRPVFSGFRFDIPENQITVLCGHNGAGKTTLLKILSGILPSESSWDDTWYVPASSGLIQHFSLLDHIRIIDAVETDVYNEAFELFQAAAFCEEPARKLSSGQSVMASVLTAFASAKNVLLLDEPYATLDPVNAQNLAYLLKKYPGTIVVTTHDLFLTLETSNSIQFLKNGEVSWQNRDPALTIDELRSAYKDHA